MKNFFHKAYVLVFMSALVPMTALAGKGGKHGGGGGGGGGGHHGGGGGHHGGGGGGGGHHGGGGGRKDVPEIDMAEGLAAVAILIAVLLLLREFNKRRMITN